MAGWSGLYWHTPQNAFVGPLCDSLQHSLAQRTSVVVCTNINSQQRMTGQFLFYQKYEAINLHKLSVMLNGHTKPSSIAMPS